ncbi:hypothetical protein [Tepidibacter hydrothermalis]|uniref:Phage protein n=1 Tax=Tepidibacter hydrothermalis TaxID=3036126 RepID=A0ABY8EDZ9_9FIRM|nr:hypothetical protein [Tepidibacter hydrothermalis]WFD11165.1 hypothetical protein P4S50_03550 [Tepidibacter hydrothermalis]
MSRFLGPIHHWLFNKIRSNEELELNIIDNVQTRLNVNIDDIVSASRTQIGDIMEDKNLEEIIDTDNIHGWLQEKITLVETRQAYIIKNIVDKFEDKGLDIIKETYKDQAIKCANDAKLNSDVSSPEDIYKALNNYILDGMPCDNVNNMTANEEDRLEWKVARCLHKGYWEKVGASTEVLYELRKIWIENFVQNVNEDYKYEFKIEDGIMVHEIKNN